MRHRVLRFVPALVFLFFAGTGWTQTVPSGSLITGTVLYRERIALPPDALVEVSLLDVSLGDASARLVAQTKIPADGRQVRIPFKLEFNSSEIQFSHRYRLIAKITERGNLLFASTQAYPVFANRQSPVDRVIMVEQVSANPSAHPPLEDTDWRLIELHGRSIGVSPGLSEAHIVLHAAAKNFTGSGGCNRLMGSFIKEGEMLRFKVVGSTMMACPAPQMAQEQTFTKALMMTARYHIAGRILELSDGRRVVARFDAQPIK